MSTIDDRTENAPTDPSFRWAGVNTDIRNRPTPNELDKIRAKGTLAEPTPAVETRIVVNSLGGLMETAVEVPHTEVAALAYTAGISAVLARRVVSAEREILLLQSNIRQLAQRLAECERLTISGGDAGVHVGKK